MGHLVDYQKPVFFGCEDCIHYIGEGRCKAFDLIPIDCFNIGEKHKEVIDGQNGDYVFETTKDRQYDRVYEVEE